MEAHTQLEVFKAEREQLEIEASAAVELRERVAELSAELDAQRTKASVVPVQHPILHHSIHAAPLHARHAAPRTP